MTFAAEAKERAAWDRCWHVVSVLAAEPVELTEFNPYRRVSEVSRATSDEDSAEAWKLLKTSLKQIARG